MVPVRKPGRPLNECPHPRGSNCGCRDLTVAIPRKRKCECAGEKSTAAKTSISQTSAEAARPATATPVVKEQPKEVSSCCQPKAPAVSSASIPQAVTTNPVPAPVPAPAPVSAPHHPVGPVNGASVPQWGASWNWNFGALNPSQMGHAFQGFAPPMPQAPQLIPSVQPLQLNLQPSQQAPQPAQQPGVLVPKRSDSDDEAEGRSSQEETSFATADEPASRSSCCSTRSSSTAQFAATSGATSPESSASSYASHSRSSSKSRTTPRLRMDR